MFKHATLHPRVAAPVDERRVAIKLSTVTVNNLSVTADIGVHPHEIGCPQDLVVHVTLRVRPTVSDRLEDTLDYTDVVAAAQSLAKERIGLIETFAYRLAEACLRNPVVEEADVFIEKPGALVGAMAGARMVLGRP